MNLSFRWNGREEQVSLLENLHAIIFQLWDPSTNLISFLSQFSGKAEICNVGRLGGENGRDLGNV